MEDPQVEYVKKRKVRVCGRNRVFTEASTVEPIANFPKRLT
jgi:hypothetical protein